MRVHSLTRTIDVARANNIPVIYAVVGFRPAMPEFNLRSERLQGMRNAGGDLEIILRAKNIDHLVLTGLSTSGAVLSTLREAVDKDYILTVLSDLCVDRDEEVQCVLTEKVFPRHADVMSSAEWLTMLRSAYKKDQFASR